MVVRRFLHGSGDEREEPVGMLFVYTAALSMSVGMSLASCFTVFKWSDVMRDAGHGAMFMVFVSEGLWSIMSLVRNFAVYFNDRQDTMDSSTILRLSVPCEVFFNATSLWFILIAYEIHRRALRPRSERSSRAAMLRYCIGIYGIAACLMATLFILDVTGFQIEELDDDTGKPKKEPIAEFVLGNLSWATWGIRFASVLFAGAMAVQLFRKKHHVAYQKLPMALVWIVVVFCLLNTPYLVLEPLCDFEVIHIAGIPWMPSALKCATYLHGAVIAVILGQSVAGFDLFFQVRRRIRRPSKAIDFFVLSESRSAIMS
ncbi:hypothetical protein H310_07287 [Aphanomyces invadans]|uniref:Intimal thickness related receptor IRP domain-containing protein n=1 Tax=Aphanomyces invadans TaxID=157072 RepID=A0A024U3A9_9STRA|nr:hypothetical protein H310_07287 [Aphanomyces invadans]ETW00739.1 hypothetical protein H310_07287 [Aphanomyces invadans]|eukprot:XP_008870874.1 hypothetical protein H310_07287 [Aphanomyces invadans]